METASTGLLLRALSFAAERHASQLRRDGETPYINHPIDVAAILADAGIDDATTLAAAFLHDTLEDTEATAADLDEAFGAEVRTVVEELTDDESLPREERKRRQVVEARARSRRARLIRIADKISNVTDLADRPPPLWSVERRREYLDWAERVVAGCRGLDGRLEARFDEAVRRARQRIHAGEAD